MKKMGKHLKIFTAICSCIIFCWVMLLSACSSGDIEANDASIAMVKNASMSTYGTGFAIGVPGKAVDTIITSYSVVATPNGAPPKTADVVINESEKNLSANVVFYDIGRNIAVLKLAKSSKELKPMVLEKNVAHNRTVYVRGYDGTGNIMSDFEKFNTTDIIQYSGNISTFDELNSIVVYKYSNEFNRALVGAPAIDESGNVVGMCAYSLNSMNTYSQYILSSDELCKVLTEQNITFMTDDEVKYKTIITLSIIIGGLLFATIIVITLIFARKRNKKVEIKGKYVRITSGALKGKMCKFNGKLSFGKDAARCDIVYPIDEPGISGLHCTLQVEDGACYLVDNFSECGTFLENGTKVESSLPHKIEDEKFVFYIAKAKNKVEFVNGKEIRG